MPLRIRSVERIRLRVPFRERVRSWNDLLVAGWGDIEVLRVRTSSPNIVGYGETLLNYTWQTVSDAAIQRVVGSNPAEHLGDDSLGAGLQMALFDVVGKSLDVPAHCLLNQPKVRDWCPISWWNTKMPPEVLAQEAQTAVAEGYLAHKIKARPWFDVREQVAAISAVVPESYMIDIDWNGMLRTPHEALPVLEELEAFPRIGLFESPIRQDDVIGHARLAQRLGRPLAEHYRKDLFPVWMRDDSLDVFVVFGAGVSGMLHQGLVAASFNKGFWLQVVGTGLTTALTLHLGAVLTHASWPAVTAVNTLADDLLVHPLEIANGLARVPTGPGLGVDVDEGALDAHRWTPANQEPTQRKILTFVLGPGHERHYSTMEQMWDDCRIHRNMPVQPRGARLVVRPDDGSAEFGRIHDSLLTRPSWGIDLPRGPA